MGKLAQRAFPRFIAIAAVMLAFHALYTHLPHYRGAFYAPFRALYGRALGAWAFLGLFYVMATLARFGGLRYAMRDGALHLLVLGRAARRGRLWRTVRRPRVRTTVLGIGVKAFFTPLMIGFLVSDATALARAWTQRASHDPVVFSSAHVGWALGIAYNLVFVVDTSWALLGYVSESRWLDNKTRSVEPTLLGWAVCLVCYPPFNVVLGWLPLGGGMTHAMPEGLRLAIRGAVVALFAIYAGATLSFGLRFSNLTNRGVVTRGPYRVVRHPAYLCKCAAWWLEQVPTLNVTKALSLVVLCGVYVLRAWTEERHLRADPAYRAYREKVRWMLLPGVV